MRTVLVERAAVVGALGAVVLAMGACDLVAGIGEWCVEGQDPGCGTGGAGGGPTGGGGAGATGGGGQGGVGGMSAGGGGAGGGVCMPGETKSCYGGPPGTEGVGVCQAGALTCNEEGTGFGACLGEVPPAAETCAATDDEDCDGKDCVIWSKLSNALGDQAVLDVKVDAAGNLFILGVYTEEFVFDDVSLTGQTTAQLYLAKLDPSGNAQWARLVGTGAEGGFDIGSDGSAVVVSSFEGAFEFEGTTLTATGVKDAYVLMLDAGGGLVSTLQFGISGQTTAETVAVSPSGDVFIGGSFDGEVNFGLGKLTNVDVADRYVAKLSSGAVTQWVQVFQQSGDIEALEPDGNGDVTLGGLFTGTANFGGNDLVENGTSPSLFAARLDGGTGMHVWSKAFATGGTGLTVRARQFLVDGEANVYLTGEFHAGINWSGEFVVTSGKSDVFLAKLDSNGEYLWDRHYGASEDEFFKGAALDGQGNIRLMVEGPGGLDLGGGALFGPDPVNWFVSSVTPSGDTEWSRLLTVSYLATGKPPCHAIVKPDERVVSACGFRGAVDLGDQPLSTNADGLSDLLVFTLAP